MRVYLRRYTTGDFYTQSRGWTRKLAEAFDFKDSQVAERAAIDFRMGDTDVVFVNEKGQILSGTRVDANWQGTSR